MQQQVRDAKALYEQYASDAPPDDFTAELLEQYELEYFDKDAEARELEKLVKSVQGLKEEAEAAVSEQERQFQEHLAVAAEEAPRLASALWDARANFEEARVDPSRAEWEVDELRQVYDEAYWQYENSKWALFDLNQQEERDKAKMEDLEQEVYGARTQKEGQDVEDLKAFKDPLDDQIALVETKREEKKAAQAALDAVTNDDPNWE